MRWLAITYLRVRYTLRCAHAHWQLSGYAANESKLIFNELPKVEA